MVTIQAGQEIDLTPPTVEITSPAALSVFSSSPITVDGTNSTNAVSVTVNGVAATLAGTTWSAMVPLNEGPNNVTAVAATAGGQVATGTNFRFLRIDACRKTKYGDQRQCGNKSHPKGCYFASHGF